jgi:hypothetical protein
VIVRILGDGPYELPEGDHPEVHRLDEVLGAAIDAGDEVAMTSALEDLIAHIHAVGSALAPDDLRPSDLVVPHRGSTLEEVQALLASEP